MHEHGTIKLFKRGPTAEFRLFVLVVLALSLLVVDARWPVLDSARRVVAVAIYPFQRLVLAPRDIVAQFDNWADSAALARTEKEALQRHRIELAQSATHAEPLSSAHQQLRPPLHIPDPVAQPTARKRDL